MSSIKKQKEGGINISPVDRFTVLHFGVGVGLGYLGLPWWATAMAAVAWEVVENPLKTAAPDIFPHPEHDSFANAFCDAAAMTVGGTLAAHYRSKR